GGERPHVELIITLAELQAGIGTGELTPGSGSVEPTPINIETAQMITCDSDVRRITTTGKHYPPATTNQTKKTSKHSPKQPKDHAIARIMAAPSEILDYGRSERIVPPGLRRRVTKRDHTCIAPGCQRRGKHTQAHHVIHWATGGFTSLDNLALLCGRHHFAVHHEHWEITPRPGLQPHEHGYWQMQPPQPPAWFTT
ncbi:MAG: HNH endonuclease signature motif containing protein, partial [Actinomycetes bacterium]